MIALVQSAVTQDVSATSGSASFTTTPTVGNVVVVTLAGSGTGCNFASATVSDNAGNTYTLRVAASFNGSDAVAMFTAPITATIAGFTVSFSGAVGVTDTDISISCWSGVDTSAVLDGTAVATTNAGNATPFAMNAVTTAAAGSMLVMVGAASDSGGGAATGTGPTGAANTSLDLNAFVVNLYASTEYGPALSTGAQVMNSNVNGNSVSFSGAVLALKQASAGPTPLALSGTGVAVSKGSSALALKQAASSWAKASTRASASLQLSQAFSSAARSGANTRVTTQVRQALSGAAQSATGASSALTQRMSLQGVVVGPSSGQ
ncbi:MAG: hypothetical protein KGI52_08425, partial [Burkholderiales bacterium]|nr:hypothetical protein [Burkholderiales bacterium]